MNINNWHNNLRTWIDSRVNISSWDLKNPTSLDVFYGFLPPLRAISNSTGVVTSATAAQDIYITIRYNGSTKYQYLPLGELEQTYVTIQTRLQREWSGILPLLDLDVITVDDCIQVQEYGDDVGDWLVTLVFTVAITWVPEVTNLPGTAGTIQPPQPVQVGIAGLYTVKPSKPLTGIKDKVGDIKIK